MEKQKLAISVEQRTSHPTQWDEHSLYLVLGHTGKHRCSEYIDFLLHIPQILLYLLDYKRILLFFFFTAGYKSHGQD